MGPRMESTHDAAFARISAELGYDFSGEIKIGGNYVPYVVNGGEVYVSGQIPRVGDNVVATGRAGAEVSLSQAQLAAKVCAMRALALLRQAVGGDLARVKKVLRISVFIQCTQDFTQHSEVSDGASEVLYAVLGAAGVHTRTSVGVLQLPKGATVELDLVAAVE
jgi:enamine deaminase RidA (YjgF/YER057c/UK114 family)